jgi:hypothetical protein
LLFFDAVKIKSNVSVFVVHRFQKNIVERVNFELLFARDLVVVKLVEVLQVVVLFKTNEFGARVADKILHYVFFKLRLFLENLQKTGRQQQKLELFQGQLPKFVHNSLVRFLIFFVRQLFFLDVTVIPTAEQRFHRHQDFFPFFLKTRLRRLSFYFHYFFHSKIISILFN